MQNIKKYNTTNKHIRLWRSQPIVYIESRTPWKNVCISVVVVFFIAFCCCSYHTDHISLFLRWNMLFALFASLVVSTSNVHTIHIQFRHHQSVHFALLWLRLIWIYSLCVLFFFSRSFLLVWLDSFILNILCRFGAKYFVFFLCKTSKAT